MMDQQHTNPKPSPREAPPASPRRDEPTPRDDRGRPPFPRQDDRRMKPRDINTR
jgi:hypothetical protein